MSKISELAAAAALDGTETLPLIQGRATRRMRLSDFLASVTPMLQNWYKGDRGDPGANVLAIGLFIEAATLAIPLGTDLVQTSGHGVRGQGHARYAHDPAVNAAYVAQFPASSFVSKNGRGFRLAETRVSIAHFGVISSADIDQTAVVQRALTSVMALGITHLTFDRLTICSGPIDLTGAGELLLESRSSTMVPLGQIGRAFYANNFGTIELLGFTFSQTAGYHYEAAVLLFNGDLARLDYCKFNGAGAGCRAQQVRKFTADHNVFREVGIYPRPAPLDPSGAGFNAAYESYAFGLRAIQCDRVIFGAGNDFTNATPASGHTADVTGGAGAFSTYLCDNVIMRGKAINAPGQGFLATGALQERDVVGDMLAGTLPETYRGRHITFDNPIAEGCNQEGWTFFGIGDGDVIAPQSRHNRLASGEIWLCTDVTLIGGSSEEAPAATHPIQLAGAGAVGGAGALHIVGSWKVSVQRHRVPGSRYSGARVDGSYYVSVDECILDNYGSEKKENYRASGVSVGYFSGGNRNSSEVTITNNFMQPASGNTAGGDIFAQAGDQIIRHADNYSAAGRATTYVNALGAFKGQAPPFVAGGAGYAQGGRIDKPLMRVLTGQLLGVGQNAMAILSLPKLTAQIGADSVDVIVNGNDDNDGGRTFTDRLVAIVGSKVAVLVGIDTGGAAERTYTLVGTELRLAMASGTYSVIAVGTQVRNANRNA